MAIMMHAEDRELRRRVYEANGTRASDQGPDAGRFDNSANIRALLRLRAEQAMALGFADPVERSLATKMAPRALLNASFWLNATARGHANCVFELLLLLCVRKEMFYM